ncbi:MAG: hypothetical protein E3J82_00450, partial [Candidatus Thorarchaeota archaeon]
MGRIQVRYTTADGRKETEEFGTSDQALKLSFRKIVAIDLSPLSHCSDLKLLDLSNNEIGSLDVSPLKHCFDLKFIRCQQNRLEEIDLSSLSQCIR